MEPTTENKQSSYLVPGAIVVAGFLIAAAVVYSNSGGMPRPGINIKPDGAAQVLPAVTGDLVENDQVLGDPNAPVTIVEFGDYQCPFCEKYFQTTEKQIIEKYVKTGKAKFVFRDFPLSGIHPMAQKSSEASECANEQGKFWQYHDMLYSHQSELSMENLTVWAAELGLDRAKFKDCLDSGKYAKEVSDDYSAGAAAGVNGTPATFINGRLISGALPFAEFEKVILEELKKAGR